MSPSMAALITVAAIIVFSYAGSRIIDRAQQSYGLAYAFILAALLALGVAVSVLAFVILAVDG